MRQRDTQAETSPTKIHRKMAKTISFDAIVLKRLEATATKERTSVSQIVNNITKKVIMSDVEYLRHKARQQNQDFQRTLYLLKEAEGNV